ncbi:S8 family peptidase [Paenibacillus sp. KS-LC4]|uniref:S8 family peptidase n=1 Tax=Paenibacillus sp. KS-LC4 TaxID=2979727 RepID=UPI0030CAFA47
MKKKWIGVFTVLVAATLLIPTAPLFLPQGEKPAAPVKSLSADQEKQHKLRTLGRDMEATSFLCVSECTKQFYKLMDTSQAGKTRTTGNAVATKHVTSMMNMHKHMSYIRLMNGERSVQRGAIPSNSGKSEVEAAVAAVKQGKTYESRPFVNESGSRFIVLGVPHQKYRGMGVVGVIKQDIVTQVERHQKRNLRLVPYPNEGNYRIESVIPNTNRDTTVKTGEDNGNASHYHVKDVVVHFAEKVTDEQLEKMKQSVNAVSVNQINQIDNTYVFRSRNMEAKQMKEYFSRSWKTEYVEPHYLYMTNETNNDGDSGDVIPNDALYAKYQWNLPSIETEKGWKLSKGSDQVIVAVLDTGVQLDHPDLQGKLLEGTNIVDSEAKPDDDVGHGTHVAGIIGASVNNGEGVAGLSWYNKVMPVKVLDSSGAGSTYSVAQGLIWATDHGAKVINMSLGNYAQADFLHDAIKYAYDHDVVLIAASGNDNTDRPGYPAAYPEVFAVAATDSAQKKASFSNYGDYIDVAAPGDSIASTYPGGQYAALSGTSMASPHVAALAGLIRSVNPDLTNEEVMEIMRKSAVDLGDPGKDVYFGYGEIDIDRALKAAMNFNTALQTYPDKTKNRLNAVTRKYEK